MRQYIGVSKHRLMAGASKYCVICNKELRQGGLTKDDERHKCVDHADWHLRVVDSSTTPDPVHRLGERWEEPSISYQPEFSWMT